MESARLWTRPNLPEDRAVLLAFVGSTIDEKLLQLGFQLAQLSDFLLDRRELLARHAPYCRAEALRLAFRFCEERLHLIQRKAQSLRFLHVLNSDQVALRVASIAARRLGRLIQNATAFVEADGLHSYSASFASFPIVRRAIMQPLIAQKCYGPYSGTE